jgi:dCMP deaminase
MEKWDRRFLGLAEHIAGWSKDPSTQVGAVIADRHNRVVSVGYNGFPRGVEDTNDRLNIREVKYPLTIHAEENAILFANRSLEGCTLYVWPLPPCAGCAAKIIQTGISRVVCALSEEAGLTGRWGESNELAFKIFNEAGVDVCLLT